MHTKKCAIGLGSENVQNFDFFALRWSKLVFLWVTRMVEDIQEVRHASFDPDNVLVSTYYTYTPKTCPWRIFFGSNIHLLITDQWVMVMGSYALCGHFGNISRFLGKKNFLTLSIILQKLPRWPRFRRKILLFLPKSNLNVTYSPIYKLKVKNFDLPVIFNIYLVDLSLMSFWVTKTEKFDVFREFSRKSVQNGNTSLCTFGPILSQWGKNFKFGKKRLKVEEICYKNTTNQKFRVGPLMWFCVLTYQDYGVSSDFEA